MLEIKSRTVAMLGNHCANGATDLARLTLKNLEGSTLLQEGWKASERFEGYVNTRK